MKIYFFVIWFWDLSQLFTISYSDLKKDTRISWNLTKTIFHQEKRAKLVQVLRNVKTTERKFEIYWTFEALYFQ
jgi:predicted N-acetyltransferase YhbS